MESIKTKILMLLSLLISYTSEAKMNVYPKDGNGFARITVHFNSINLKQEKLILKYWNIQLGNNSETVSDTVIKDLQGDYHFNIPVGILPKKIQIYSDESGIYLMNYYVEEGDEIKIETERTAAKDWVFAFSGRGMAKYECRYRIYQATEKFIKENPGGRIKKIKDYDLSRPDKMVGIAKSLLDHYKPAISSNAYFLLKGDIIGGLKSAGYEVAKIALSNNIAERNNINDFIAKLDTIQIDTAGAAVLSESESYLGLLLSKIGMSSTIQSRVNGNAQKEIYQEINRKFKPPLSTRLVNYFLLTFPPKENQSMASYKNQLEEAIDLSTDTTIKRHLIRQLAAFGKGEKAYNFVLPDISGKRVSLSQFKGKVVLLDFWFTGCVPCMEVAKMLHSVIPVFVDNQGIVFVSINADKSRNIWESSVRAGKYTSPASVNLFTDGLAFNHPLIKYYNFQSFPQLLLIDKNGKIYSSALSRERAEIITLIKNAVNGEH